MPWVGDKYVVEVNLTESGIKQAIADIKDFEQDLEAKIDEFTERMAEKGVEFAKAKILEYGAIDTGELYNSINLKKGDVIPNGSCWIVYTECPYAQFVEFGTGPVGAKNPHPEANRYRSTGWSFPKPANWYGATTIWKGEERALTMGQKSKPFMWDTKKYLELESTIREVAKEVFG